MIKALMALREATRTVTALVENASRRGESQAQALTEKSGAEERDQEGLREIENKA